MPFKVVKTIENGLVYVEAVPSGWEINGILSWPTSGNIERFRSNANSLPGENWITCPCVVISTHETFREAIHMERLLEKVSTESEDEILKSVPQRRRKKHYGCSEDLPKPVDYNKMIAELSSQPSQPQSQTMGCNETQDDTELTSQQSISGHVKNLAHLQISTDHMNLASENPPNLRFLQISENGNAMPSDHLPVLENLQEITLTAHGIQGQEEASSQTCHCYGLIENVFNKVESLEGKVAKLTDHAVKNSDKLDRTLLLLSQGHTSRSDCELLVSSAEEIGELPLSTEEGLDEFEKKLCDQTLRKRFINHMKTFGGTSGKCESEKIAFKIVDIIFTRNLLKLIGRPSTWN
ncbi:uncharacterized protein LOC129808866 isoform X2 [Phlebotomus papatasi]|uniref:uncharacterized protein LOC129803793 isoform X2 n=1 Tax=Phlebotomus papatasi TaxID=29031 RepID=UPI0024841F16|nr:uncharacterized protein LOC129803793 isoform X2 [Phlebotomus papatasi]XP_055714747.1 uncharacterized protein LOC129808866 isoform X2 [Phlebotomus papatasi]